MRRLKTRHLYHTGSTSISVAASANRVHCRSCVAAPAASPRWPRCRASVLLVALPEFVGDYLGWSRPRVQIAKTAITCNDIRIGRLESAILAVPVSIFSDAIDCAPGGIAISSAGCSSKRRRRCKSSDTKYQFRECFQHDEPSVGLCVFLNKHRNSAPHLS